MIPYFEQPSLSIGPLTLHTFGLLVAIGIILATRVIEWRANQEQLDVAIISRMCLWIVIGGFIGAHLVDSFVYYPQKTWADPLRVLRIWDGISSYGGFVGAMVTAAILVRHHQMGKQAWNYLDVICYGFPVGWIFGRFGCFSAHDHPGSPTNSWIGVRYPDATKHDLGLEEALYTILIAGIIFWTGRSRRPAGFFCAILPLLYAPFRFFLDYRRTVDVRYAGLTPGQYGSVALFIFALLLLQRAYRRPDV